MASHLTFDSAQVHAAVTRWFADQARQGFFATDRECRVIVWNRWMEMHSGLAAASVLGRSIFELYPDAERRGIHEYYINALAGQVTIVSHGLHRHVLPFRPTMVGLPFVELIERIVASAAERIPAAERSLARRFGRRP